MGSLTWAGRNQQLFRIFDKIEQQLLPALGEAIERDESCEGLSFADVHADGQVLCEQCADQTGIHIVACDCL